MTMLSVLNETIRCVILFCMVCSVLIGCVRIHKAMFGKFLLANSRFEHLVSRYCEA